MDRRGGLSKHYFGILHSFAAKMTQCAKRNCEVVVQESRRFLGRRAVQELGEIEERAEDHATELLTLVPRAGPMRRLDARLLGGGRWRPRKSGSEVSLEGRDGAGIAQVQARRELVGMGLGESS